MNKIKVGDSVIMVAGKDKGKVSEIIALDARKVKVRGLALVKVFKKRNPQKDEQGGIFDQERWVDISNVCLYDVKEKQRVKVGIKTLENNKKVRINKRTEAQID
jgi:large subunit ribosomal protein L24